MHQIEYVPVAFVSKALLLAGLGKEALFRRIRVLTLVSLITPALFVIFGMSANVAYVFVKDPTALVVADGIVHLVRSTLTLTDAAFFAAVMLFGFWPLFQQEGDRDYKEVNGNTSP
jgi:type IV secretory pathway VirB3-like protein